MEVIINGLNELKELEAWGITEHQTLESKSIIENMFKKIAYIKKNGEFIYQKEIA